MTAITIYSDNAGRVVRVLPPGNTPMLPLNIDDWDGFEGQTAIVTGIDFDRTVKAQFRDMFDESVYVYVFGDKLIDLRLTGLLFARHCDNSSVPHVHAHGVDGLLAYYDNNAVSVRDTPVVVQVGESPGMHAVLYSVKVQADDNEHGIGKFVMLLKAMSQRKPSSGGP